jgi:glycosyltransferase involved in cell wall biosynthesis
MDLRYIFQNIARPFRNPVGKLVFWAARLAHHVILISNNEYRLVTSRLKQKDPLQRQIIIVKNGVVDQKDKYPPYRQTEDFVFCLASRIVKNKGIGEAIEAFASLEENHKYKLKIYGNGPDMELFKKMAKPYANIIFFGHQSDALAKINEADVFMLPSYQEGFSIALLEATMLGKAIIASDVDSNSEIIVNKKTGLLARVKDPKHLAERMQLLISDNSLRHSLEVAARKNFEENFDLDTIVRSQIIPLYK